MGTGITKIEGFEGGGGQVMKAERLSVTQQLKMRRDALAAELEQVTEAIEALEADPKLGKVFDLVSKAATGQVSYYG